MSTSICGTKASWNSRRCDSRWWKQDRPGDSLRRSRSGTGAGERRAAAHWRRRRRHDVAYGAGSFARMIHLPASVRVYLCLTACDMRKSFDGLHALVREHLELDAFAGHLFVFASRRRDRVKILYWDRDGFAVWSKRLERSEEHTSELQSHL